MEPKLELKGLLIRPVNDNDRKFIYHSWKASSEPLFIKGLYEPWVKSILVINAFNSILTLPEVKLELSRPPPTKSLSGRIMAVLPKDDKMLNRIISNEFAALSQFISKHSQDNDIKVIVDNEHPNVILAWYSPHYSYIKQIARGLGIEEFIESQD